MAYLDKDDYFGYITIAGYGMCTYFILRFFEASLIWVLCGTMLVSVTSMLIGRHLYNKPIVLKLLSILAPFIILISTLSVGSQANSSKELTGVWLSDGSDGLVVKMRASNSDSLYLSMSPDFEEVGYMPILKNDTLCLIRNGEVKLKWYLKLNDNDLTLRSQLGELTLSRKE